MSQKSEIYASYCERERAGYPTFFEPEIVSGYHEAAAKMSEAHGCKVLTACCKFWGSFGDVKLLPDGRVFEIAPTTSGISYVVAVFMSESLWRAWNAPMSYRAYFEHW